MSLTAHKNTYLSLQSFCAPFRRPETLFKLNAIAFDIDAHEIDDPSEVIVETLNRLNHDLFENNILPTPSMTIYTGRGLQLVYLLEPLPRQGVPLWSLVSEGMAKRLRTSLDEVGDITLDHNYTDVTRVLRIPGTYNMAAGRYARIIAPDDGETITRYRLDELRDGYLPELMISKDKKPSKKAGSIKHLFNAYSLHIARLEDIVKLRELRKEKNLPEDHRKRMLFLYRYWSCFYIGEEAAEEGALAFNRGFKNPLPERTALYDTKSAEEAYKRWHEDRGKGYNYCNKTLIEMLGITEEEQRHLKTIIGQAEKKRRQQDKNWYHDKRDKTREEALQSRDEEVVRLLREGYSYKVIEAETGIMRRTISRIARQNGVIRKQGQRVDVKK